ncbi:MAG: hypothetical protein AB1568_08950 [Thermodesulfobacteriota bacterium]
MTDPGKTKEQLEKDFACSAYAEAGEPCPLPDDAKTAPTEEGDGCGLDRIEDDLACAAFAEAGEPCPIKPEKRG